MKKQDKKQIKVSILMDGKCLDCDGRFPLKCGICISCLAKRHRKFDLVYIKTYSQSRRNQFIKEQKEKVYSAMGPDRIAELWAVMRENGITLGEAMNRMGIDKDLGLGLLLLMNEKYKKHTYYTFEN